MLSLAYSKTLSMNVNIIANYNKVNLNTVFEITIEVKSDEDKRYVFNSEIEPVEFIERIKNDK